MSLNKIKVLRDSVAQKIAAGEVIDRPFSVVRELLDNSIDAQSKNIILSIKDGGISNIRLVDDGIGMSEEDLKICWHPHATSKISEITDLDNLYSLGFRGEALPSIAACSRLSITSSNNNKETFTLNIENGKETDFKRDQSIQGTIVNVSDLFYSIPARKKFLKRPAAESTLCKNIFIEKAIAFNNISFKLFIDDELKLFLPESDIKNRILNCYSFIKHDFLKKAECIENDYKISIVYCSPEITRKDRKNIQIFVNKRKIYEYAFIQAVEYAFKGFIPGGNYPAAFVFIEINPSLVDFNIHPAKKEARFKNRNDIHHSIVKTIQENLYSKSSIRTDIEKIHTQTASPEFNFTSNIQSEMSVLDKKTEFVAEIRKSINSKTENNSQQKTYTQESPEFLYFGQIFSLFLLTEYNEKLYIIDQHAAHEKILFNKYIENSDKKQKLLIPLEIETENTVSIEKMTQELNESGIILNKKSDGIFELYEIPEICNKMEKTIKEFIENFEGNTKNLKHKLFETLACKAAVKDGDVLDDLTALKIIEEAFKLENARCPHGRPVWFEISKKELFHFVGRL